MSSRKRRLSTPRTIDTSLVASAAAGESSSSSSSAAASKKKTSAARKSTIDGFEFTKKRRTREPEVKEEESAVKGTSAAAAASSSASASASAAAATAAPAAVAKVPSLATPPYPSQNLRAVESFTFDASRPLPDAITQLCRDVFAREQTFVESTYGAASTHKAAAKGRLQFVVTACARMAEEVTQAMTARIAEHMASAANTDEPPVLENATNTQHRASIERWTRLAQQADADRRAFQAEKEKRAAALADLVARGVDKVVGAVSAEDEAFLAEHKGGQLAEAVSRARATVSIMGNDAISTLDDASLYVASVHAAQKVMGQRINQEEKKAYGAAIGDARDLITMITAAAPTTNTTTTTSTAAAPDATSTSNEAAPESDSKTPAAEATDATMGADVAPAEKTE